jgi:hypothetical protein
MMSVMMAMAMMVVMGERISASWENCSSLRDEVWLLPPS